MHIILILRINENATVIFNLCFIFTSFLFLGGNFPQGNATRLPSVPQEASSKCLAKNFQSISVIKQQMQFALKNVKRKKVNLLYPSFCSICDIKCLTKLFRIQT